MFVLGPVIVLSAIGFFCWLLFTLAVYALPAVVGVHVGVWACQTGAGPLGGVIVGLLTGGATFGVGQWLLIAVPWNWARLLIVAIYTVPAVVAGYSATHGVTQMAMPSPVWQTVFSVVGAIAVGVTALLRISGMTADTAQPGT